MSDAPQTLDASPTRQRRPRHWLQFRLRTALWLLLVVALGLAWWRDREQMREALERSELLREAARLAQPSPDNLYWQHTWLLEQWMQQGLETTVDPLPEFDVAWQTIEPVEGEPLVPAPSAEQKRQAVQDLIKLLSTGDAEMRARAACTLGHIGPDAAAAAPELRRALYDDDRGVRWHAVFALGRLGPDPTSAAALREIMADDVSGMPAFAARALTMVEHKAPVVPRLLELLGHPQPDTRRRAAKHLQEINTAAVRAAWRQFIPLLTDPDPQVRREAISAVKKLAPRDDALDAISAAFKTEADDSVKRHAASILIQLDGDKPPR